MEIRVINFTSLIGIVIKQHRYIGSQCAKFACLLERQYDSQECVFHSTLGFLASEMSF